MTDHNPRRPASILVWLSGALGDTLLVYPSLAALRVWAPEALISFIARPAYGSFALSAGLIDRIDDIELRHMGAPFGGQDAALKPPELAIVWSSAYREYAEQLDQWGARAIIAAPTVPTDTRHQARYLLDCLRPLGIPKALTAAPPPPLAPLSPSDTALLAGNGPVVLLHPGAGSRWKRWPLAGWLALAGGLNAHGYTVLWSCGPADDDLRAALLGSHSSVRTALLEEQALPRFAAFLNRCALFISADAGVAHLAALLRVPQVTLFGPTDPRRWRPLSRAARVVVASDRCGGRWEGDTGSAAGTPLRRCAEPTKGYCSCLAALPVEAVLSPALTMLGQNRAR